MFAIVPYLAYYGFSYYKAAPDIREEYFKTHERVDVSYKSNNVILTKGIGVLIFMVILLACALLAKVS